MSQNHTFNQAHEALRNGKRIRRASWHPRLLFIFAQVPSTVPAAVVPKMSSLPRDVKHHFVTKGGDVSYENQVALVFDDNRVVGFNFTGKETMEDDWEILESDPNTPDYAAAPVAETAGTAIPDKPDLSAAAVVLELALYNARHNEPIHRAEGNTEQADLALSNAASYEAALAILKKA